MVVIGHEKGNDTRSRIARNFGMARPEGYRKAIRLMDLADRFGLPVITLVDTPGAYPGKGAEERGQAEAIARSTEKCLQLGVPLVSVIIGEGGSGGAVAFATADRIAMLEHSIYSVISPEGCASILWKDAEKMKEAAEALRLTAQDLLAPRRHRPHRPRAAGRRPARQARGHRPRRHRDRRAPRRARRQEARRDPQGPPPQVPRHGAEVAGRLTRGVPAALRAQPSARVHVRGDQRAVQRISRGPRPRGRPGLEPRLAHQPVRGRPRPRASTRAMNSATGSPGGIGGRNSTTASPGRRYGLRRPQNTPALVAAGTQVSPKPVVEHPGADLERQPRPRRHPGALRIDHQLPRLGRPRPACSTIVLHRLRPRSPRATGVEPIRSA